ncbi:MAG: hypothetical protein H7274_20225, partial [Rhodoferax sp.]|nr:hypothetical protein [Rhodoferax sp.]
LTETTTDTATAQARTWAWTYNAQGLADSMTDPKGGVWQYNYDARGNRLTAKNPLNQQTSYAYDSAGRVTSQTGPNGLVTSYAYDARDRLTQTSRAGETSSYSYTPFGQLASASLPNGYAVSYSYDAAQRLVAANDNRSNQIQYTLDAMGNRIHEEVKDASGAIALATSRVINNLNKLAAVQGATGQTTQLGYDANGEPVSQADPLNQTTRQTLDGLRRPTATTFADNASATQSYNQLDQLTAVNDPKGVQTSYQTNAFGEVMSETSPDIGTVKYERDALGDVTKKTDAKGNVTTITRDALGRPLSIQYAADHIVNYTYDSNQTGYLRRIEDKSGTTTYERDVLGRITSKTQTVNDNPRSPSRYRTSYSYTAGDLASITYPSGLKVIYRRNASGQITGIDTVANSFLKIFRPAKPFVSDLTYTALQQPKSWTWASGDSASRTFDTDGRMTANEFASYTYDAASRITGITQSLWASGIVNGKQTLFTTPLTWTAGYDNRNRLTSFDRAGASTSYTYDANSNRLTSQDTRTSDTDLDLDFASADMSQATGQALNVDAASNRLFGFNQRVTTSQSGKADAITKTTVTYSVDVNYSVDENGAMTSDGLRTFEYDASNRMDKVRLMKGGEAASITYLHNALGQRVFKSEVTADQKLPKAKTLGTGFVNWLKTNFHWMYAQALADASIGTAYIYGGDNELPAYALLAELDNGSAVSKGRTEYIYLPTQDGSATLVGLYRGGKFLAVHTDHLGTPRLMTDEVHTAVWQRPYAGFGMTQPTGVFKATPNPKAVITNSTVVLKATNPPQELNVRESFQYEDEETGMRYNALRTYCPKCGRYTQMDPIGLAGGLNRLGYVGGSPLAFIDPHGLNPAAGWVLGMEFGTVIFPGVGTVVGGLIGAGVGAWIGWNALGPMLAKPPENAYDPNGPKAPGKPTEADGFKDPKGGENWVPNPNPGGGGSSWGWQDKKGNVWCPTGPEDKSRGISHGGPHWDVQSPGGGSRNVRPQR